MVWQMWPAHAVAKSDTPNSLTVFTKLEQVSLNTFLYLYFKNLFENNNGSIVKCKLEFLSDKITDMMNLLTIRQNFLNVWNNIARCVAVLCYSWSTTPYREVHRYVFLGVAFFSDISGPRPFGGSDLRRGRGGGTEYGVFGPQIESARTGLMKGF